MSDFEYPEFVGSYSKVHTVTYETERSQELRLRFALVCFVTVWIFTTYLMYLLPYTRNETVK